MDILHIKSPLVFMVACWVYPSSGDLNNPPVGESVSDLFLWLYEDLEFSTGQRWWSNLFWCQHYGEPGALLTS